MSSRQMRPSSHDTTGLEDHVLQPVSVTVTDVMHGRAAEGVLSFLEQQVDGKWKAVARGASDPAGMISIKEQMRPGVYRLELDAEAYFTTAGITPLIPRITITFRIPETSACWLLQTYIAANSQFSALFRAEPPDRGVKRPAETRRPT
jgi:5-hydroxyisourate hydrolase-like protein (transthyretin family)